MGFAGLAVGAALVSCKHFSAFSFLSFVKSPFTLDDDFNQARNK